MKGQDSVPITSLLLIYAAVLVINVVLSGFLWARYRTALHRSLFVVWACCVFSLVLQGALTATPFLMVLGLLSGFPVSVAMADLLARVIDLPVQRRAYWVTFGCALAGSSIGAFVGLPFWLTTLPAAAAMALPVFDTPVRALLKKSRQMSTSAKAAALTCIMFGLNYMDYPFLRNRPIMAVFGFSVALLVIFAASITLPAVVLERVVEERTRIENLGQLRSRFFANVSHELRTPLTMILAPLEGLLSGEFGPLTAVQKAYLQTNQKHAVRLLKLINDLLDLAKKEEGFLRLRVERSDLRPLLEEVVAYARPLAARKNLKLDLEIASTPQDLYVDLEKLERVLVNLISNALKFTTAGGVTVALSCSNGEVQLSVSDTGIGIAAEALPNIFERFRQGDGSVTRRFGGTGIGLAYAQEIVNLHGGNITVESSPGKGSRFNVRLREGLDKIPEAHRERRLVQTADAPTDLRRKDDQEPREWAQHLQRQDQYRFSELGDATERRAVTRPAEVAPLGVRIMVVEDHADILELVNLQLRDRYSVYVAENGKAGLELARRENPDLIITDFMMPEMDGLSMVKELRADPAFQETSIIMLTAKNQLDDRLAVRAAGVDIFLGKPFSPRELDAAVRQLLERRGRHVNRLMRAQAEGLEVLSGGLAHEIYNPLNFIKGAQRLIAEQIAKIRDQVAGAALTDPVRVAAINHANEKIDRMVKSAGEGISRIEGVVAMVRRYAREGFPKEVDDVMFDQAVKEVAQLMAPPIDAEWRMELDLQAGEGCLRVIPAEFNQAVRSLLQNAIEATPSDGVVRVRTRAVGSDLILEVADTGPGIPAENINKIFSPFFTSKAGVGRGLGLSTAQLAVSRAGGSIEVASLPGSETTFRVRLPNPASAAALPIGDDSVARAPANPSAPPTN